MLLLSTVNSFIANVVFVCVRREDCQAGSVERRGQQHDHEWWVTNCLTQTVASPVKRNMVPSAWHDVE